MALPLLSVFSVALNWWKAKQQARIAFFRAITDLFARHWRIILVLAILTLALLKLNALVNERNEWKSLYKDLEQSLNVAKAERAAELKAASEQGKKDLIEVTAKHQSDITRLMRKAKHDEEVNTRTINNYRDGLRLAIQREANLRAGVPEDDSNSIAGTDSDTAATREQGLEEYINTLEQAGAVCAADYNLCRDYVKKEQSRLGVENPTGN